jgi:hypothetical protein
MSETLLTGRVLDEMLRLLESLREMAYVLDATCDGDEPEAPDRYE